MSEEPTTDSLVMASAALLLELAFLVPPGTDMSPASPLGLKLIEFAKTCSTTAKESVRKELEVTNALLADRQRVLDAIPPCPVHGSCVPHALAWVEKMKKGNGDGT